MFGHGLIRIMSDTTPIPRRSTTPFSIYNCSLRGFADFHLSVPTRQCRVVLIKCYEGNRDESINDYAFRY